MRFVQSTNSYPTNCNFLDRYKNYIFMLVLFIAVTLTVYFQDFTENNFLIDFLDPLKNAPNILQITSPKGIVLLKAQNFDTTQGNKLFIPNIPINLKTYQKWDIVGESDRWRRISEREIASWEGLTTWCVYCLPFHGVRYEGALVKDYKYWYFNLGCQVVENGFVAPHVAAIVPTVINIGVSSKFTYGHLMADIIPPMFLIPMEIRAKAYVVHGLHKGCENFIPLYSIAGISADRVIMIDPKDCVFAFEVWTATPWNCETKHTYPIRLMRNQIDKMFPNTQRPTRIVALNRTPKTHRHVLNMDEVVSAANKKLNFSMEVLQSPNTLPETVKLFHDIRFMFNVAGSVFVNMYFMAKGSVVAEIQTSHPFIGHGFFAIANGIKYCIAQQLTIGHFNGPVNLNVDLTTQLIETAIKRMD